MSDIETRDHVIQFVTVAKKIATFAVLALISFSPILFVMLVPKHNPHQPLWSFVALMAFIACGVLGMAIAFMYEDTDGSDPSE